VQRVETEGECFPDDHGDAAAGNDEPGGGAQNALTGR